MVVQPVDRTPRDVLGHALDLVVIGPAIPAIEVALVFDKQVSGDGVKLPGRDLAIRESSGRHLSPPLSLLGRSLRAGIV
jgi:hypothetical protein